MIRRLAPVVAATLMLIGAVGAVADPSIEQLGQAPVYVSPAVVGTGTPDAIARLTAVADELRAAGRPVRIVVVKGPSGASSMRQYATQLRHAIEFDGLVVAVAPGRATGVAGPRSQAAMTTALRNAKVGTIADPVERAAAAARAAAGPPDRTLEQRDGAIAAGPARHRLGGWRVGRSVWHSPNQSPGSRGP